MDELIYWIKNQAIKKYYAAGVIVVGLIILLIVTLNFRESDREYEELETNVFAETSESIEETTTDRENTVMDSVKEDLMIELKGQVHQPGVYTMREGNRLIDAVTLAGGLTEIADDRSINMSLKLVDQMMIYIPFIGEEGIESVNSVETSVTDQSKININHAELQVLTELNGIGNAKAQTIIQYREENGRFETIEEIKNVSGIGEKIFESIKNEIVVD